MSDKGDPSDPKPDPARPEKDWAVSPEDAKRLAEQKELRGRLDRLSQALDKNEQKQEAKKESSANLPGMSPQTGRALSLGMRVVSELVAGVFVGLLIGYGLDKWLGTSPFLMIVFLLLGMAGGIWNVVRSTRNIK